MSSIDLGPRQQRAVAAAITVLAVAVVVAAMGALLWLTGLFARTFAGVFLPLAVALVIALVCKPWFDVLRVRWKLPTPLAIAAFLISGLAPLVAFGWFFGALLVGQVGDMVAQAPGLWSRANVLFAERWPQVERFLAQHGLIERIQAAVAGHGQDVAEALATGAVSAGRGVLAGVGVVFGWAVLPVYLVFFLLAPPGGLEAFERNLTFLKAETRTDLIFLVREFVGIVVTFFRGQLIIAVAQGILYAIGFTLIGLRYGFVLGLVLGFLNVIPYLGSIVGLGIGIPLGFFQEGGSLGLAIWVVVVFTMVQMVEGYLLTPRIMGDRTGLHPLAIIVAVLFWGTALGGVLGMILAIPLTAFAVVLWRLVQEKYIAEIV